jgi:hypothetical protein
MKLQTIFAAITDAFDAQPENASWGDSEVSMMSTMDKGETVIWLKKEKALDVLGDASALIVLNSHDFLLDNGLPQKKRVGSTTYVAYGIRLDALRKKVEEEQSEDSELLMLRKKVKLLEKERNALLKSKPAELAMAELAAKASEALSKRKTIVNAPSGFDPKKYKDKSLGGVPVLLLSDWHWGEVVDADQINGFNEFNLEIAHKRCDRVFDTALELLLARQAGMHYEGIVVPLLGDMLSGNIHEELQRTNDVPIMVAIQDLADKLSARLLDVAQHFEWVYVPCVVGNHGRIDRKPVAKNAPVESYEHILYRMIQGFVTRTLGENCNVQFEISPSLDMPVKIYNTGFLLTHGDQIKGGSGIGNFWPSMIKTYHKKQANYSGNGMSFDYMVCGHFHHYGVADRCIVNGSLKGYDEWVASQNFAYESPIQALWVVHPHYGITAHYAVYADEPVSAQSNIPAPVSRPRKQRAVSC